MKEALLGLLQGITEFLPVSSSGHLVVGEHLLGLNLPGVTLEILLHLATLLAVVVFLRHKVLALFVPRGDWRRHPLTLVVIGTLPAAVVGLLFQDQIRAAFETLPLVGVLFMVNGGILMLSRLRRPPRELTPLAALLIGTAQVLALFPGISRSGTTITAALLLGIRGEEAFDFSFLLLLPAVLGGTALDLLQGGWSRIEPSFWIGAGVAFVSGIGALWLLKRSVVRHSLHPYGYYTFVLGLLVLLMA